MQRIYQHATLLIAAALFAGLVLGAHDDTAPGGARAAPPAPGVAIPPARLTPDRAPPAAPDPRRVVTALTNIYHFDLGRLGIRPLASPPPPGGRDPADLRTFLAPDNTIVGNQATMNAGPDIAKPSTPSAWGAALANFAPDEDIWLYFNGVQSGSMTADAKGRGAFTLTTDVDEGAITILAVGLSSGKRASSVVLVSSFVTNLPGFAVAPHAISRTAGATITTVGTRWPPNSTTAVTLARDGVAVGTATTDNWGTFYAEITVPAGPNTAAVYSANSSVAGSLAGQSIEERSDAGVLPLGDQNLSRVLVDRPVTNAATGGEVAVAGAGFQPGETVAVSDCFTRNYTADAQGAFVMRGLVGTGVALYTCIFSGNTSGRTAVARIQAAANAVNIPAAINAPSNAAANSPFVFTFTRLNPNQSGTIYIDGTSQGSFGTNSDGSGSVTFTAPAAQGIHSLSMYGGVGTVGAPLWVGPPLPPTATLTPTPAPTATPTPTGVVCATPSLIDEGFESGTLGGFTSAIATCVPGGCAWNNTTTTAHGGTHSVFVGDPNNITDQRLELTSAVAIPAGASNATLTFWHRFSFENGYDGGVLEVSTDGGATWADVGAANITGYPYNGTIASGFGNPLAGRPAWTTFVGSNFGLAIVNLNSLIGQNNLKFRFRFASDNFNAATGWWIDDVVLTLTIPCVTSTPAQTATPTIPPTIPPTATPTPPICATPSLIDEGFESGTLGGFSNAIATCVPGGCAWNNTTTTAHGGTHSVFVGDPNGITDQRLELTTAVAIPAGASNATLTFWHRFSFENGYDGGVLEVSTDGGATWADVGAANITGYPYNGTIPNCCSSPLAGRPAWTVFVGSNFGLAIVNLNSFIGQNNVKFRFRFASDAATAGTGWWIDDVVLTLTIPCGTPTATATNTATSVPPTNTALPPTATNTALPPTATATNTTTSVPPTNTSAVPPTQTPGGPTATSVPPTTTPLVPTQTPGGPTATSVPPTTTPLVPTQTPGGPTATPVPPTTTPLVPTQTPGGPTATSVPPTTTSVVPPTTTPLPPTSTQTPCPITFGDVPANSYYYIPVQYLYCRGIISGYADNTFRPFNETTRGQMVKIVVGAFGVPFVTPTAAGAQTFADVPTTQTFYAFIEAAAAAQVVSGYNCGGPNEPCDAANRPYFRPNTNVTRGQLSKIVAVAAGWTLVDPVMGSFTDVLPGTAFYTFVETASCKGVISGYACGGPGEPCDSGNRPYFRPFNNAVRAQIAKIVYGALTTTLACGPP